MSNVLPGWMFEDLEVADALESLAKRLRDSVDRHDAVFRSLTPVPPNGDNISTVGQLRAMLAEHADDALVWSQGVGADGSAWNLYLHAAHGRECGFKWDRDPVILSMSHPNLLTLRNKGELLPKGDAE